MSQIRQACASSRSPFLYENSPRKSGRFSGKNSMFLENVKFFNVYPFALKATPQSLLCCLGRSVTHYLHPRNCLEGAWKLSRKVKISWKKSGFSILSSILTNLHNHSWTLSDTLSPRMYIPELRFSIRSTHGPSKSTKCKKYGNHRASATFSRMEHIFKTLSPVNLGLQNFPGPLAHTIRTGTYQSPPGTVLEQI